MQHNHVFVPPCNHNNRLFLNLKPYLELAYEHMIRNFNMFITDTGDRDKSERICLSMILDSQFSCILVGCSKIYHDEENTKILKYGTKCC